MHESKINMDGKGGGVSSAPLVSTNENLVSIAAFLLQKCLNLTEISSSTVVNKGLVYVKNTNYTLPQEPSVLTGYRPQTKSGAR